MDRIVDIHNHIIFDVDDGPDTLQTSMDMMRQAVEKKVTDIVATPHQFEQDLTDHVRRQEKVLGNFEILKAEVKKEKLPLKLHLGAEIFFSTQVVNAPEIPFLTVNNQKKYALIEFSMNWQPEGYKEAFYELIQNGCTPILAHPERYGYFWDIADDIIDLVKMGTLLQINAGSLLGYMGTQALFISEMLLSCGLAHVIASDAHRARRAIGFNITRAADEYRERYPEIDMDRLISENPLRIVQGETLEINEDACYNFNRDQRYKQWRRFYFRHDILGIGRRTRTKRKKRFL
ncbi:MAG: hypothetical protein PHX07_02155 [Candidatus Marinimicrobia bacterium]|nr:hypothetical protein [Candidatus Neomarinimicrobiota bacterium]MDD5709227.1 hypothetical protein [Candidatus Neomarinimicrobiota bacterium]